MTAHVELVVFRLAGQRYALRRGAVERVVRALRPGLKVLFVSGHARDVPLVQGLLERGVALLHKPFTDQSLGQKVREVLDA
jgi:FixJ family two-component response regulator